MGAQDQVYIVGLLQARRLLGGTDAACEGNSFYAALAAQAGEFPEMAPDAVDGVLADVAGVEYHEVGILVALDFRVSCVLDHTPYPVGVVYVHLAPERPDARSPGAIRWAESRVLCGLSGERYGCCGP